MTPSTPINAAPAPLFVEHLRPRARSWFWLLAIVIITFLAVGPIFVPFAIVAWGYNVGRFWRSDVRIYDEYCWVGRRWVRLAALDLTTLGRASNTWPWRAFSSRYLGANPIWTRDSVGVRGIDGAKPYWVAVGTNRRDELIDVLTRAVTGAQERVGRATWAVPGGTPLPPPGWHSDPWQPGDRLRWWDGAQWTGHTAPRTPMPGTTTPGSGASA